jgi:hypothetical protein
VALFETVAKVGASKAVSSLPGAIQWVRGVAKKWRASRSFPSQVMLRPGSATINLSGPELGFLRVDLTVLNSSNRAVQCDRMRLSWLSLNSRNLPTRSEYLVAHADISPRSPGHIGFTLELYPHEIKSIVGGIGPAQNALSDPDARLTIAGAFVVQWGRQPAEAAFNFVFPTSCIVSSTAAALRQA